MCAWWPTAMNAQMHERLVFPEIWSPCKQQQQHTASLSMTNNNNNNIESQLEMKSSSWRALEVESKSEATTNCTNLLGQKKLRRIRTRQTCGVTAISEGEPLNVDQQGCRKQESGRINSGFLKGRGDSDQVERNLLQEHARLEWQSFENRDVKQGVVQVKKQKCGTKRTPDSTYSDVYKCKLGWSKDHSGGIDSGGKVLKNMPFVDKNGAEDVKFRIGALKKPKVSQTKDLFVKEKIHSNGHWLNTPLCNFQMDTMNSVIKSKSEDATVEQRGGGGSQTLNISSEEESNHRNQSSSHHPSRLSCPEMEMDCSDSPLACSFISFRTGESRMERRPHHTSAGVNPAPHRQHGAKELQETRKPTENSTEMLGSKLMDNNLQNRKASSLMMQRNGVGRIEFPYIPNLEAEKIAKAIPTTLEGQVSVAILKEGERDASASSARLMQLNNGSQEPHNYSSSNEADEGQAVLGTPFSFPPESQIVSLATTVPTKECVDRNGDGVVLTCSSGNELNCCLKNSNFCKENSGSPATAETTLQKSFQAGGETNDMNAAMASDDSLKNLYSTPSLLNNKEKCAHQYSGFPVLARSHCSKNCAGGVEGDDQKVREGNPDSWHRENDGRKIVSGGNVQLLIREERSCLRRASAVEVQRNVKFESPTPALDQAIAMNLVDLSNGKSETFWDAREQLDGSPPQITPLEFPKDDIGKEHDSHQTVADKLLVESVETHMWPGWEKFSSLEGHQAKAWQQPKGDLQSYSLQSESKLSSQIGAFFSPNTRSCGKVVAEGPGTPTCPTGVAIQPVGNHCSIDELHITQNGTLDSNRLHCEQLSCPQSGPLDNAGWETRGAHVQNDMCVFKLTKSSGLAVKVPYSDESSPPLEVTKISEGALVNSEDKAHNAPDQKPDFRYREMETVGANAAMDSKAYGANLDHNLEMAFQGLGLSDCLIVPETNIGDLNFGSCETMLSEQDLLHKMTIEESQASVYSCSSRLQTGEHISGQQFQNKNTLQNHILEYEYAKDKPTSKTAELTLYEQEVGQWQEGRIATDVGAKHSCRKELHADRRRRIPIALRVKNGLKNGWLMQNWTRGAAKPKSRPEEQEISTMEEQILEMGGQQNDLPKTGSQRPNHNTMNSNWCNNRDEKPTPYSVFLFNQGIDDKIMTNFHFRGNVEPAEKVTDMPRPKDWAENHDGSILIVRDKSPEAPLQRPGSNKSEETSQSIYSLWGSQSSFGLPFGEANQSKVDTKTEKIRQTVSFYQGGQSSTNPADGLAVYNLRKMLESGALTSQQRSVNRKDRQERSATDHCNSKSLHDYSGINVKHQNDGVLQSLSFQSPERSHPKFSCGATQGNESCLDSSSTSPGKLCDNQENDHFFHSNCEIKQSSPPEPLSFHFVHSEQLPVSQSSPFPLTEHVATKFDFHSRQLRIGNKGSHGPPAKLKARRHYAAASVSACSKNKPVTSESRSQHEGRQSAACDLATSVVEPLLIETLHRECTQEVPGTITDKPQQYEPTSNLVSVSADGWEPSSPGVQAHACAQGGESEDLSLSFQNYSVTKSCRHHSEAGFDKTMPQREVSPGILMPQKPLINIPERNRGDTFWDGCKNGQRGWPECPAEEFPKEEEVFLEKFSRTKIDMHPNPPVHTVFDNPQHSRANSLERVHTSMPSCCSWNKEDVTMAAQKPSWGYPQNTVPTRSSTMQSTRQYLAGYGPQASKSDMESHAFSCIKFPHVSSSPTCCADHLATRSAELGAQQFWQHSCEGTEVTSSASHFRTENALGSHHPLRHNTGGVGLVEFPSGYMQSNVPEYQRELQGASPSYHSHCQLHRQNPNSPRPSSGTSSQTMPRPVYDPLASHNGTACHSNTYPRVHGPTAANYQHCGWEHNWCAVPVCTAHPPKTENVRSSQMHPTTPRRAFKPQEPKPSCVWQDQLSTSLQGTHSACSPSHPWPYAYPPPPPPCPSCSAKSMSPMDQEPAPSIASASSGSMQQQKLLWLSDAELELIRQLRQHGVKGTVRDSNASQPEQPFIRAPMGGRSKSTTSSLSSYISSTDNSPRLEQEGRIQNLRGLGTGWQKSAVPETTKWSFEAIPSLALTNVPDGRHNAAACIQRRWRQYACEQGGHHIPTQKKTLFLSKSSTPDISLRQRQLHYSQLRQTAIKLQAMRRGILARRWFSTLKKAAIVIQRCWRDCLRKKAERRKNTKNQLPKNLKDYYFIVKRRYTTRGLTPPSYEKFARSLEKIQAATRGARVRCRLKSRRLQTIIMEIKEIRALLEQMSHETVRESSPYLVPQLCRQLQQKINQLHTALTGPETEARFVLRRGPASPLVMCTSRSPVPARKLNHLSAENMPIKNSSITSVPRTATSLKRLSECNLCSSTGDHRNPVGDIGKFHWYFSPSHHRADPVHETPKSQGGQVLSSKLLDADNSGGHASGSTNYQVIQTASKQETESCEHNGETLSKTDSKSAATEGLQEMGRKTLPLTSRQIDEQQLDRASEIQHSNSTDYPDIPKRPFLRRKSVVMPAQKLDWSKVKPVVSSRLEPELQTKLSTSKPKSNPPVTKSTKTNYGNVKSRLFSYETASSPNSSREGSRGYSSDVEIRRTHIRDRASLEATNYSPPHNNQMSRYPDLNMEPSHRMKFSKVESARSTFTSEPQNDDIKFGRSSAVRHMNTQKKPWVRYIRKSKPVVVEEKVGGLDLGRLPKIKVRCNPKENIKDPFQLPHKPQEEPSLWGHNIQAAEKLKKKGSHSYRYANSKDMQQGYAAHLAARNEESVGRRDTPQPETKKAMHHNPAEMPLASKELESLFGEVMTKKHENKFTLKVLFGTKGQEGSIIPRLHPASHIFQASFTEKNELFQVLKGGRATQCRQDCLSFISSRSDS